ncbi:MAG TPA: class I SAM-dependent methyltransferase [Streptosporangiaceae bacterium]|jgi:SAM-dependent methyltransferase
MHSELASHPDSTRWNARYQGDFVPSFTAHPLAELALSMPLPAGPVLDLACGPSGSALLAAAAGHRVTAVDISDVALALLAREAARRGLAGLIELVHADLGRWRPQRPDGYAFVLATGYWDRALFAPAAAAVTGSGLLAWEAFTAEARRARPSLSADWCLAEGEPACLLPPGFEVISQSDHADASKRRLLARRR